MQVAVEFIYETSFSISDERLYVCWLTSCANKFKATSIDLAIAFMDDDALHTLNVKHLNHDTLTDIITFDDSVGTDIVANVAISIDRVFSNAQKFSQTAENELLRVISHGLLHCLGFNDKTEIDKERMKEAEDVCIELFHVERNNSHYVS